MNHTAAQPQHGVRRLRTSYVRVFNVVPDTDGRAAAVVPPPRVPCPVTRGGERRGPVLPAARPGARRARRPRPPARVRILNSVTTRTNAAGSVSRVHRATIMPSGATVVDVPRGTQLFSARAPGRLLPGMRTYDCPDGQQLYLCKHCRAWKSADCFYESDLKQRHSLCKGHRNDARAPRGTVRAGCDIGDTRSRLAENLRRRELWSKRLRPHYYSELPTKKSCVQLVDVAIANCGRRLACVTCDKRDTTDLTVVSYFGNEFDAHPCFMVLVHRAEQSALAGAGKCVDDVMDGQSELSRAMWDIRDRMEEQYARTASRVLADGAAAAARLSGTQLNGLLRQHANGMQSIEFAPPVRVEERARGGSPGVSADANADANADVSADASADGRWDGDAPEPPQPGHNMFF